MAHNIIYTYFAPQYRKIQIYPLLSFGFVPYCKIYNDNSIFFRIVKENDFRLYENQKKFLIDQICVAA